METDDDFTARKTEANRLLRTRETEIRPLLKKISGLKVRRAIKLWNELEDSARNLRINNKDLSAFCDHPNWAIARDGDYGRCLMCGKWFEVDDEEVGIWCPE